MELSKPWPVICCPCAVFTPSRSTYLRPHNKAAWHKQSPLEGPAANPTCKGHSRSLGQHLHQGDVSRATQHSSQCSQLGHVEAVLERAGQASLQLALLAPEGQQVWSAASLCVAIQQLAQQPGRQAGQLAQCLQAPCLILFGSTSRHMASSQPACRLQFSNGVGGHDRLFACHPGSRAVWYGVVMDRHGHWECLHQARAAGTRL